MKNFFMFLFIFIMFTPQITQAVNISASSAILISDENIIYEKNAYKKMPMASTTKIMTAICAIENTNTNMPIRVDDKAVGIEGSSIYLEKGEIITLKELIYGMMLNSGNDAATAIAIAVGGSVENFCKMMNQCAKKIGAINTNFTNPSGLYDENHYTTACDLAKITVYAMKNPLFKDIVSRKSMKISKSYGVRYLKNHNKLLNTYDGCIGVKTGYTKKCGRCLVSSAERGSKTLVAVTLNAPDDWRDHKLMLDMGFN